MAPHRTADRRRRPHPEVDQVGRRTLHRGAVPAHPAAASRCSSRAARSLDSLTVGENVACRTAGLGRRLQRAEIPRPGSPSGFEMVECLPATEHEAERPLGRACASRVWTARAISADPEMILYDEPTTGLDPVNTRRINELILSIQARLRVASLVVTLICRAPSLVSNRVAMLSPGPHRRRTATATHRHSSEKAIQKSSSAAMPVTPIEARAAAKGLRDSGP